MKKNLQTRSGKIILTIIIIAGALMPQLANAQVKVVPPDSIEYQGALYQKAKAKSAYPKVVGYVSFILPLETLTLSTGKFTPNFSNHTTTIGFPVGVNVLYSDKFGFSYEFTPNIKASGGSSKMNDILFDPGTMFRFQHGFTLISRLAFDTNGRYGFTPVFNQVYARTKAVNYFVALSLPTRFGNSEAASLGLNMQIGFTFN
ncbi:hypothetical protein SAMN05216490_4075 [Mucilaginibacter mallensis]|uniref:Outer membrane protein beta-barrel domain-containing protein n=1 Tax=Mucilaginibacter mallensis TaxID=652787 RepID=A0A1H2BE89_MUCMA|nr:hypothetical protein [Mucilaginibacter mallensis]SDT56620.1 hypothetical protein SAMN05216490_4075 [Mucilaginibacter mallensis]